MSKAVLYFFPGTCAQVTAAALEETGTDYEIALADLRSPEAHERFHAINPKGKVPALVVDGEVMFENPAILWFLAEQHPGKLFPATASAIARQRQLSDLVWCGSDIHPMVRQIRMPHMWTAGDLTGVVEDGTAKFKMLIAKVLARVNASGWWYPERWSIVDTYLWWCFRNAERGGFDLGAFAGLEDYLQRIEARPSIAAVLKRQGRVGIAPIPTSRERKPSAAADLRLSNPDP